MTVWGGLGLIFAWFLFMWGFRFIFVILAVKMAQKGLEEKKSGRSM